jgi:hypothetical protein
MYLTKSVAGTWWCSAYSHNKRRRYDQFFESLICVVIVWSQSPPLLLKKFKNNPSNTQVNPKGKNVRLGLEIKPGMSSRDVGRWLTRRRRSKIKALDDAYLAQQGRYRKRKTGRVWRCRRR